MDKKIYKYHLEFTDLQTVEIPGEVLSVEEQNGKIVVYALVNPYGTPNKYEFGINGTGNPLGFDVDKFIFLGTVKIWQGSLMFHVFYRRV